MGKLQAPILADRIERWPVERLKPYDKNPRTHSPEQLTQLKRSIAEFGFTSPILVDGKDGILAGHGRLMAAKDMGLAEVPVLVLDHLTPEQRRAYVIADNQLALNAGWDMELLQQEVASLNLQDFDLDLLGFDDEFLEGLLDPDGIDLGGSDGGTEGLTDPDEVPEPPAEPVTKPGDVWLLGGHRVMCGDSSDPLSINKLLLGKLPDAVVTDPPYGIGIDGQKESKTKNPKHNRKAHEFRGWDNERPDAGIFNYIAGINCPAVIWGGNYFADLLPATRGWIYWSKGQDGLSMSDGELAWTTESKPLRCVTVNRGALQGSVHPTQKPLQVIEFSLDYITAGNTVLDLFGGSGSTLIACEKTGRQARLMELDPRYCDVIVKRWQDFTGKTATLEATGEPFQAEQ
jgi:hypothetical protein